MTSTPRPQFWIGPAGWSYEDWYGTVYPLPKPRGFKPLAYLARYFNAVEVNTSFYRIPSPALTEGWVPQVPAEFRFTFKLPQSFTHERGAFPSQADVQAFQEALRPIQDADRLGGVLVQFPWSFRFEPASVDRLLRIAEAFPGQRHFVEVRHRSWAEPTALDAIRQLGACCNIDQPHLRDCLRPSEHVLDGRAYVRLHGRNARAWFAKDVPRYERYNYLYSREELAQWIERLDRLAAQAHEIYVITNNHYRGQAPANALEIKALLEARPPSAPADLVRTFPRLADATRVEGQGELF